jgi:hypothetical protein
VSTVDRVISVGKDLFLFIGGSVGIGYQQVSGNVNMALLGVFTAMVGVPGLTNLVSLLRGTTTNSPSQSPVLPPSLPESDSSSSS